VWNRPVAGLDDAAEPVGPCGGAAAFRTSAFREVEGFDETFFAYWEDVDLALRLRLAGHRCVRASSARALHKHGQTLGAASPAQRRLEAFGRGYVLAHYRVARQGMLTRVKIAVLDWPVLLVHLLVRRETGPLRERSRGTRAGLAKPPLRAPFELATVGFGEAFGRQVAQLRLRATGSLPSHFDQSTPSTS
jgi:N-acetylglucosaminyl-diphospho-decaprenol L-rhamnosyltransferase